MNGLNQIEIAALLATPAQRGSRATKRAWIRKDGAIVTIAKSKVKSRDILKFEGKQGSRRRSSKGRSVIMPDGWVKYADTPQDREYEVIAYSA